MMRRLILSLLVCAAVALPAAGWPAAAARAETAPTGDLAAMIAAAEPGAVLHVPAGVYAGPLTIDKPVTLEGEGMPVIQGTGEGDVIVVTAPDVTIRGFEIRGSGNTLDRENAGITVLAPNTVVENNLLNDVLFGVYFKQAPGGVVRNNVVNAKPLEIARRGDGIRAWYSDDILIEGNRVVNGRDTVIWFSNNGVVRNNVMENSRYGMHYMFSNNQVLENNIMRGNSVGAYLMYGRGFELRNNLMADNRGPSGYGIGLKDADDVFVSGNRMVNNRVGIYNDNSPREADAYVRIENNLLAYNEIGVMNLPLTKRNVYTRNVFLDNGEQLAIAGSGDMMGNFWSEAGQGNYWSDYAGFDADGDGVGDLAYEPVSLYESLMGKYPELRLFQSSPAVQALDFAARAFPIFQPRPKMADEQPLMAPPELPPAPGLPEPQPWAYLLSAVLLLALAFAIAAAARQPRTRRSLRPAVAQEK